MILDKNYYKNYDKVNFNYLNKEYPAIVVGKAFEHIIDFYIIEFEEKPFAPLYDYDCMVVSESQLTKRI